MEDQEISFDQMDRLVLERKEYINESIINECETSLHTIKNQMLELKSRLYRNSEKPVDTSINDKTHTTIPIRSNNQSILDDPPHKLNDLLQENYKFEAELARLRDENESYKRQIDIQNDQIVLLNQRASVSTERQPVDISEKVKNKLESLERENGELVAKNARLENELAIHKAFTNSNKISEEMQLNLTRRVQELEIENIKLSENNEYLMERIRGLESSYRNVKHHFDQNLSQYEGLLGKIKENEDDKEKYVHHAKKLDEQLKAINLNYVTVQKRATTLEKENKELVESNKHLEAEKRNLTEKWLKLSKRNKSEEHIKISKKNLENTVTEKSLELEELREKFASATTELQVLRESERTYKELIEERSKEIKLLNERYESDTKDKEILLTHNLELIEKLERIQAENASTSKKTEHIFKEKEEYIKLRSAHGNTQKVIKKLELEKAELSKRLVETAQELEKIFKRKSELEQFNEKLTAELNYTNSKWQYLVKEHEKLKEEHTRQIINLRSENELYENLQKKNGERDLSASARILFPYEPSADPTLNSLKDQISRVQDIDKSLCDDILRSLDNYVENLLKTLDIDAVNNRYNKLLVKYYKNLEKLKEYDRGALMRTEPVEYESNIESLSLDTSGFRSVFQSASNHNNRPVVTFEDDKKSFGGFSSKNLFDSFDAVSSNPLVRHTYKENISRSNSNERKNPILSVPELLRNSYKGTPQGLNRIPSDSSLTGSRSFKASRSVEKLGIPKKPSLISTEPLKDSAPAYAPTPLSEAAHEKLKLLKKMTNSHTPSSKKKLNLSVSTSGSKMNRSYTGLHSTKSNQNVSTNVCSTLNNSLQANVK